MTRLFSLLYIAASHTVHVHYFSCVLLVVIYVFFCLFLYSLLYIAASHTVHVHYFSCVLLVVIYVGVFVVLFVCVCVGGGGGVNTLSLIFFSVNVENVGEC